jgi:nicotinamide-nucleotide amidase
VDLRFIGPKKAVDAAAALARVEFKDQIYAEGLDMMEHVVVHLARARKLKLATVESCTGGFIANRISNVPFGSEVLGYGWVTASNEAKMTELGVPPELIETHGLALAVTGVPGSFVNRDLADTMENAPGSIHLALAQKGLPTQYIQKRVFRDREVFKYMASQIGLNMMREALLGSGNASS